MCYAELPPGLATREIEARMAPVRRSMKAQDPEAQTHGPRAEGLVAGLAAWFAATFEASEMMVIGGELPKEPKTPLRAVAINQAQL